MKQYFWIFILLTACTITSETTINIVEENNNSSIQVYFCQKENCEDKLSKFINNDTVCAFYSLNSNKLRTALKNSKVFAEKDNKNDFEGIDDVKYDNKKSLMHNKFCVLNNVVVSGSWNPATNTKTANNLIILESKFVSQNYKQEFEELRNNNDKKVKYPQVILNEQLVENYFCPEDSCQKQVLRIINSANESIYFMTYSFTDDKIGDLILKKSKELTVKGIFDSSQTSEWSEYEKLKDFSIEKKNVHHKVFVIDNKIVITGSYNPTANGNSENDENILITHNSEVAKKFVDELNSLFT